MIEIRWLVNKDGTKVLQYSEYEMDEEGGKFGYGWQDVPEVNEPTAGEPKPPLKGGMVTPSTAW